MWASKKPHRPLKYTILCYVHQVDSQLYLGYHQVCHCSITDIHVADPQGLPEGISYPPPPLFCPSPPSLSPFPFSFFLSHSPANLVLSALLSDFLPFPPLADSTWENYGPVPWCQQPGTTALCVSCSDLQEHLTYRTLLNQGQNLLQLI